MRPIWLFVVGISLLGCKDKQAAPPAPAPAPAPSGNAATAPSAPGSAAAPVVPPGPGAGLSDRPSLESAFAAEPEDKVWADATEAAIQAVAPELTNVSCHQSQCEGTLTAVGLPQIAIATDKLDAPDKLPSTGAKHILLTEPAVDANGKLAMKIFIRYER